MSKYLHKSSKVYEFEHEISCLCSVFICEWLYSVFIYIFHNALLLLELGFVKLNRFSVFVLQWFHAVISLVPSLGSLPVLGLRATWNVLPEYPILRSQSTTASWRPWGPDSKTFTSCFLTLQRLAVKSSFSSQVATSGQHGSSPLKVVLEK